MTSTLPLKHLLSLVMLLILVGIHSCKKDILLPQEIVQTPDPGMVQQAKDWYQHQLSLPQSDTDENLDLKTYTPDWSKVKMVKNSKGQKVIGVPLFSSKLLYIELNVLAAGGKTIGIFKKYVLDADKKIKLIVYTSQGNLIANGYYDQKRRLFLSGNDSPVKLMGGVGGGGNNDPIELDEVVIAINPYEDGEAGFPVSPFGEPAPLNMSDDGNNGYNYGGDPNYDGGSSEPLPEPVPADVENDLTNPCLKNRLNSLMQNNFSNRIKDILINVFDKSPTLLLNFEQVNTLPNTVNAWADPRSYISGDYTRLFIQLNGSTLPNASSEYVTTTLLHETLHQYFGLTDNSQIWDHEDIALAYRGAISQALQDIYGTNPATADALAWQGLFETSVWNTYSATHPNQANQIATINQQYHDGTQGTPCN